MNAASLNSHTAASSSAGRQAAFTLIELMIVMAMIAIIVAIAIPNLLDSRKAANEGAAITYMRTWAAAQERYRLRYGVYSHSDALLINERLISAPAPDSHGYIFHIDSPPNLTDDWWGSGAPATPGATGDRYFYTDITGVIRFETGGPASALSPSIGE